MTVDEQGDVAERHAPFATEALGQMLEEKCVLSGGSKKYLLCGVGCYNGTRPLKSGGEMTVLFPAHKGAKAHDSTVGKDAGVGAGSAFTNGDGVSKGRATE